MVKKRKQNDKIVHRVEKITVEDFPRLLEEAMQSALARQQYAELERRRELLVQQAIEDQQKLLRQRQEHSVKLCWLGGMLVLFFGCLSGFRPFGFQLDGVSLGAVLATAMSPVVAFIVHKLGGTPP